MHVITKIKLAHDEGSRKSQSDGFVGPQQTMTTREVTGFYAFFLRMEIGQFSPRVGAISLRKYTENLEKKEKTPRRKLKKIQWRGRPESCLWSNVS